MTPAVDEADVTALDMAAVIIDAGCWWPDSWTAEDVADAAKTIARAALAAGYPPPGKVAAVRAEERERVLAEVTAPFVSLLAAWQHLRMDTPEDQARHDRLIDLTRRALTAAPGAAARDAGSGHATDWTAGRPPLDDGVIATARSRDEGWYWRCGCGSLGFGHLTEQGAVTEGGRHRREKHEAKP